MMAIAAASVVLMGLIATSGSSGAGTVRQASQSTGYMASVSCEPGQCVAVGALGSSQEAPQASTLSQGRWSTVTLPVGTPPHRQLSDVSCPQPGTCVAVGTSQVGTDYSGFAETLAGGAWTQTLLPSGTPWLRSVSCVSPTWCMAVGSTVWEPLSAVALLWNGATWSQLATAAVASATLYDLSCVSIEFCMAVGYTGNQPLAEEWNGSSWTLSLTPPISGSQGSAQLDAVSCVSASSCVAVGVAGGCCGAFDGVAMSWDGSSWTNGGPTSSFSQVALSSIACTSASSCLAVGLHGPSDVETFPSRAVVERWNGTVWSPVPLLPVGSRSWLRSVSCTRVAWCVAVGYFNTSRGLTQPLVERWNGLTLNRMWAPA